MSCSDLITTMQETLRRRARQIIVTATLELSRS
jgi:hypothetical protein